MTTGERSNRLTGNFVLALFSAVLGTWFPHGYTITAINGPQTVVVNWIRSVKCHRNGGIFESEHINGTDASADHYLWCRLIPANETSIILAENRELNTLWAVSSAVLCCGALVGSLTTNTTTNWFGIKKALILSALILAAGSLVCAFAPLANAFEMFIIGRLIIGLGTGIMGVITPVYITEITPVRFRGAAGVCPIFGLVIGMMTATGLGFPQVLGKTSNWAYLVGIPAVPVFAACLLLLICGESPRYLYITKGDKLAAEKALIWFRGTMDIHGELEEMQTEKEAIGKSEKVTNISLLCDPFLRRIFILVAVPMLAQEFSGLYAIVFFSTSIFEGIGWDKTISSYATMGLWVCNLIVVMLAMLLVDRLGRRTLLLLSELGAMISLVLFVVFMALGQRGYGSWTLYAGAGCMPLFIITFGFGLGSIPWILPVEMFAQNARGAAASLITAVSWASALAVTFLFPLVVVVAMHYTFLIFAGLLLLATVFVWFKLPETKGKTFQNIQQELL